MPAPILCTPAERIINFLEADDRAQSIAAEHAAEIAAIEALTDAEMEKELAEMQTPYEEGLAKTKRLIGIDRTGMAPSRPRKHAFRHRVTWPHAKSIKKWSYFVASPAVAGCLIVVVLFAANCSLDYYSARAQNELQVLIKVRELESRLANIETDIKIIKDASTSMNNSMLSVEHVSDHPSRIDRLMSLFGLRAKWACDSSSCAQIMTKKPKEEHGAELISSVNYK